MPSKTKAKVVDLAVIGPSIRQMAIECIAETKPPFEIIRETDYLDTQFIYMKELTNRKGYAKKFPWTLNTRKNFVATSGDNTAMVLGIAHFFEMLKKDPSIDFCYNGTAIFASTVMSSDRFGIKRISTVVPSSRARYALEPKDLTHDEMGFCETYSVIYVRLVDRREYVFDPVSPSLIIPFRIYLTRCNPPTITFDDKEIIKKYVDSMMALNYVWKPVMDQLMAQPRKKHAAIIARSFKDTAGWNLNDKTKIDDIVLALPLEFEDTIIPEILKVDFHEYEKAKESDQRNESDQGDDECSSEADTDHSKEKDSNETETDKETDTSVSESESECDNRESDNESTSDEEPDEELVEYVKTLILSSNGNGNEKKDPMNSTTTDDTEWQFLELVEFEPMPVQLQQQPGLCLTQHRCNKLLDSLRLLLLWPSSRFLRSCYRNTDRSSFFFITATVVTGIHTGNFRVYI